LLWRTAISLWISLRHLNSYINDSTERQGGLF
jgi:hypothetical protein